MLKLQTVNGAIGIAQEERSTNTNITNKDINGKPNRKYRRYKTQYQ